MEQQGRFISVDDHVLEHPQVWTQRLSRTKWGDRIPHIVQRADGSEHWVIDGRAAALNGVAAVGAVMGERGREPQWWEEFPTSAYVAAERLRAMDADGVSYSVLYPTVAGLAGETFGRITDPEFELACVQAYNDWVIEEWATVSPRFIPQCLAPLAPIDVAVREIRRAVNKGHKGVIYPAMPMHLREVPHINDPYYDPLWAVCQELGVPVCFHAGAASELQLPPYAGFSSSVAEAYQAITRPSSSAIVVANLLVSGVLTRYPNLKVVFAESGLGWVVFTLECEDHQYERFRLHRRGHDLKPSELFQRQCYVTAWYDHAGLHHTRRHIGAGNILWSTNFPLTTSTWPNSRDFLTHCFQGVPESERQQMLWGNAAALYQVG
jgi:predicted TIM-barrel fold metal-dependent hydrolase